MQKSFVFDINKCTGCEACRIACSIENRVDASVSWRNVYTFNPRRYPGVPSFHHSIACHQCVDPPCMKCCPALAFSKDPGTGSLTIDSGKCIGCRYCVISCPYNARYFNFKETDVDYWPNKNYPKRSHGVAESCNFCAHLLDRGKDPACVTTCREIGVNALVVGDLDDPESEVSKLIDKTSPKRIREDLGTEPKVYYIGL